MKAVKKLSGVMGLEEDSDRETVDKENRKAGFSFISQILDDLPENQVHVNPQFLRIKNNILLVIMFLSAYGIFFLIGDFINILLIAYIAGIAYQQMRSRFVNIVLSPINTTDHNQKFLIRLIKSLFLCFLGFALPFFRFILGNPQKITSFPTIQQITYSFTVSKNIVIYGCQLFILIQILNLLAGYYFKKAWEKIRPTKKIYVKVVFAFLVFLITILTIIIVPSILFKEASSLGYLVEVKVEEKLGCQILAYEEHDNKTLPYCSEKITTENKFIMQSIQELRDQNETISMCLKFLQQIEKDYTGNYLQKFKIQEYDQIICTWYSLLEKAANYSGITGESSQMRTMVTEGASIFKTVFGGLAIVLGGASNFIFSFTTFITMFYLTTQHFKSSSGVLKDLFSQHKNQLISSITDLIQATLFIAIEHFAMSIMLLQLFKFTSLNLSMATVLSSMAFFPFFRPWFGVLIIALFRMLILKEYTVSLLFVGIYYLMSERIYSNHYRKMDIHEIITNMSVLFGIYQFGIAGIFYGPLIIILYKFVEKELLRNEVYRHNR